VSSPPRDLAGFVLDLLPEGAAGRLEPVDPAAGEPPVAPLTLARVLLYAWSLGITSSRLVARSMETDDDFRTLASGERWGHQTLIRFREQNEERLRKTLVEALRGCQSHLPFRVGRLNPAIEGYYLLSERDSSHVGLVAPDLIEDYVLVAPAVFQGLGLFHRRSLPPTSHDFPPRRESHATRIAL